MDNPEFLQNQVTVPKEINLSLKGIKRSEVPKFLEDNYDTSTLQSNQQYVEETYKYNDPKKPIKSEIISNKGEITLENISGTPAITLASTLKRPDGTNLGLMVDQKDINGKKKSILYPSLPLPADNRSVVFDTKNSPLKSGTIGKRIIAEVIVK